MQIRLYIKLIFFIGIQIMMISSLFGSGVDERLDELKLPAVEIKDWKFKEFPIAAWWPPPGDATIEDFKKYKEAGFTIYAAIPNIGFEGAIDKAERTGLAVLTSKGVSLTDAENNKAVIIGSITGDEPRKEPDIIQQIGEVNRLMRQHPDRRSFFNLLPPQSQKKPDTNEIIAAAVKNGMKILSYDNYVMYDNGRSNESEHFINLEIMRLASLRYNIPFWAFALTSKHDNYRRPSESDLRWKQFTNLAYGAKGLWYFCYWGAYNRQNWEGISIVDPQSGLRTKLYDQVKELNQTILDMGDILLGLTSEIVVHNKPTKYGKQLIAGEHWISNVVGKDVLIGFFYDTQRNSYALLVNKMHGKNLSASATADDIEVTFAPWVKDVYAISWLDGITGRLNLNRGRISMRVFGGTGVLLRLGRDK